MRGFRHGLIFFLSLLATFALGDITESKNWLITSAERSLIRRAQESTNVPPPPYSRGIGIYARHYGGFAQIYVIGNEKLSAKRIAESIGEWLSTAGLTADVKFSQGEEVGPTAMFEFETARFGTRHVETRVPVKSLITSLSRLDPDVSAVWYVPGHVSSAMGRRGEESGSKKYYDLSEEPPDVVEVSTEISALQMVVFALFGTFVPLCALFGGGFGAWYAKKRDVPIEKRRKVFSRSIMGGVFGGMAIHFAGFLAVIATSALAGIADAWFAAARTTSMAMFLIFAGFPIVLLLFPLTSKMEMRLFGPDVNRPAPAIRTELAKKRWSAIGIVKLVAMAIGFGVLATSWNLGTKSDWQQPLRLVGMVLILTPNFFGLNRYPKPTAAAGDRTLELAREVAAALGRPTPTAHRTDSDDSSVGCAIYGGRLDVTPAFEVDLNADEMRFLIARAVLAEGSHRLPLPFFLAGVLPAVVLFSLSGLFLTGPWRLIAPMALLPLAALWPVAILRKHIATRHRDSLSGALRYTRNLTAARSALEKHHRSLPLPHHHDEQHAKDLRILEETAREIGLD